MMMVASNKTGPFRRLSNTIHMSLAGIHILLSLLLLHFVPYHHASGVPKSFCCGDDLCKVSPQMTTPDTSTFYFRLDDVVDDDDDDNDDDDDGKDENDNDVDDGMECLSGSDTIVDNKFSDVKKIKCSIFDTDSNVISEGLPNENNKHKRNELNLCNGITVVSPYRVQYLIDFNIFGNGILHKNLSLYNPFDDALYIKKVTAWLSVVFGDKLYFSCLVCHVEEITASLNCDQLSDEEISYGSFHRHCQSWVDMQPHSDNKKWEIRPHDFKTILTVNLLPHQHVLGNVSGFFNVHFWNVSSLQGESADTVKVPLEEVLMMQHKVSRYHHVKTTGSISVIIQHLVSVTRAGDDDKHFVFLLSLRNDVSQILQVVKVCEKTNNDNKFFRISYNEGLIIYPGIQMDVAFIMYNLSDAPCGNLNCVLQIETNEITVNSQIEIPCWDLVCGCSKHDSDSTEQKRMPQEIITTKHQDTREETKANELMLRNRKLQGTTTLSETLSVLEDHDMIFPVVEVGTHCSKWIHVRNPSEYPVVMQLSLSSVSKINQCILTSDSSEHHVTNRFTQISSTETSDGFSLGKSAIIEAFVHPLENDTFGPIVFHPSDRCRWTSSAQIKNNLSGVEWLHLQGMGGTRALVILEDSKAVEKLEFNVDWSLVPPNLSTSDSMFQIEHIIPTCKHVLSKELHIKNAGQLSLQVLKMQVSGASCGLDGFTIHTCKPFTLAPGESTKLHVSYKVDFSISEIRRDLELALASGIFVIPMKVNIPMDVCNNSFGWSLWGMFPLIFIVLFPIITKFFGFLKYVSSSASKKENCTIKSDNAIASISKSEKPSHVHRNPRNQRKLLAVDIVSDNVSGTVINHQEKDEDQGKDQGKDQNQNQNRGKDQDQNQNQNQGKGLKTELTGEIVESSMEESPQLNPVGAKLTVKIKPGKGRRRKRQRGKVGVCSSQSGNSTPSPPLSPNILARPATNTMMNNSKPLSVKTVMCIRNSIEENSKDVKSDLLSCDSFYPSDHDIAVEGGSPIARHSRAPGPRLGESKLVKRRGLEESGDGCQVKEYFAYDIWGDHFPDHIMGRSSSSGENKLLPWLFSESSMSLFTRDPQFVVKMRSKRSASPNPKSKQPCYGVNLQS